MVKREYLGGVLMATVKRCQDDLVCEGYIDYNNNDILSIGAIEVFPSIGAKDSSPVRIRVTRIPYGDPSVLDVRDRYEVVFVDLDHMPLKDYGFHKFLGVRFRLDFMHGLINWRISEGHYVVEAMNMRCPKIVVDSWQSCFFWVSVFHETIGCENGEAVWETAGRYFEPCNMVVRLKGISYSNEETDASMPSDPLPERYQRKIRECREEARSKSSPATGPATSAPKTSP